MDVGATSGTTARPHCSAAPLATFSHLSERDPFRAGRAAASVRAVITGRISLTPSSVAFWITSSMRSPFSGERASTRRSGDSGRAAIAEARRASTPCRATRSSVASNSWPAPSKIRTASPERSLRTSRA